MTRPGAEAPWGRYRPGPAFRVLLAASRAVPQIRGVKQLCFLFRRWARAVADDPVDVHLWGHRLRLHTRGNISEGHFLFFPRGWDREERRFLARHLRDGAVFVDIGANAGGYVWWVRHLLGERGRVVAVEPDPDLRARLLLNLRENGAENVAVHGVAVGPAEGEWRLRIDSGNRGENVLVKGVAAGSPGGGDRVRRGDAVEVDVRPLPELLEDAGVERVDALKIDVEGLEPRVLGDFLDRAPERLWPHVLLTEHRDTPEHRELLGQLHEVGYEVELRTRLNLGFRRTPHA